MQNVSDHRDFFTKMIREEYGEFISDHKSLVSNWKEICVQQKSKKLEYFYFSVKLTSNVIEILSQI